MTRGFWAASRVARYRLRAAGRRDWAGYLAIVLIVGILGGVAMASVAAARRTQSAVARILAASNPSDLDIDTGSYSAGTVRAISRLPQVRAAESYVALNGLRALPSGFANIFTPFNEQVEVVGSLDGLYLDQDRVIITDGRLANPRRAGEIVISEQTARRFGLRPGQSFDLNLYSGQQAADPRFNPMTRPPVHRVRLTITGIGVFTDEVVQDDIDRIYRVLTTPALTRKMASCCGSYFWTGLKLARGQRDVAAVQQEYIRRVPAGTPPIFRVTSVVEDQGERAVRPESVAAAVFGLIAALIALVLATQAIRRKIVGGRSPRAVLRAVGASPLALVLEAVVGILCAIATGVVLAVGVAVAVSPVAPLGVLHRLEPAPGVSFDWLVLGVGAALFLLVLSAAAVALACGDVLARPHRRAAGDRRWAAVTAKLGLPVAARAGVGCRRHGPGLQQPDHPAHAGHRDRDHARDRGRPRQPPVPGHRRGAARHRAALGPGEPEHPQPGPAGAEHNPGPVPPGGGPRRGRPAAGPDRRPAVRDPDDRRGPGSARPASRRDRQLPDHGHRTARPGRPARGRGRRGAGAEPGRLGAAPVP
jgi:hypothetical protein